MSSPFFPEREFVIDQDEGAGVLHIVPTDDTREHIIDADGGCWCDPTMTDDGSVCVHNSADGREAYEEGRRKPH